STVHILSENNYVVATGTPAPKPTLPNPSDTYQLEFKHSNKVIQIDTGESMETGIAEGFGASIGVDGTPVEEIGGEMGGDFAAGDFVMDAALLQKTADKSNKSQHWTFKDAGSGFHQILSSTNSEALELKGEGSDLFPSTGKSSSNATQLWKLEDAGNGYYRLLNKANNKYLEVPENDQTEDAMLHYGPKSGDNQLVKLVKVQ
ncbi:MAG: RICIN domain-containing protein, partial [Chitinophagales bacterium]